MLQICEDLEFDPNSQLFSGDFEALYTNINSNDALETICDFLQNKINSFHINIT